MLASLSHNANILKWKKICRLTLSVCVVCWAWVIQLGKFMAWVQWLMAVTRSTHREGNRSVAKIIYAHWMAMWSILLYRFAERTKHLIFGILEFVVELLSADRWMIPYIFIFIFWWCLNWWLYYDIFGIWKSIGVWSKCSRCSINLQIPLYIFSLHVDLMKVKVYPVFYYFLSRANVSISLSDGQCAKIVRRGTTAPYILVFTAKRQTQSEQCGKKWKMIRLRLQNLFLQSQLTSFVFLEIFLERKEQKRKSIPTIFAVGSRTSSATFSIKALSSAVRQK